MTTSDNIVAFRLPEEMIAQLDKETIEEGFKTRSDLLYKIVFDYLRSRRLDRSGHRIVYEGIIEPQKPR